MSERAIGRLLIANRGEIAVRIAATARELGIATVAIFAEDDAASLHVRSCDTAVPLRGTGPAAYLDIGAVIAAARDADCDTVHPGYGLLSESAAFAVACGDAGLRFVGPPPAALAMFGDKGAAKDLARSVGVAVLDGARGDDRDALRHLVAARPAGAALLVKATAGGGGRGIRLVEDPAVLDSAIASAGAEALAAFGSDAVIVEPFVRRARHLEVQVIADRTGAVHVLGDRDCTVQRRNQKVVEIAPAPDLTPALRARLHAAAHDLIAAAPYAGLATVEFLLDLDRAWQDEHALAFIEVNPRLQVEHTITEMVSGVDLVAAALRIAAGARLDELSLPDAAAGRGTAIQLRVSAEAIDRSGQVRPTAGTITALDLPGGPGIRIDHAAFVGFEPNPRYDALLLKLVAHAGDRAAAIARARRALSDLRIAGLATNAPLLARLLDARDMVDGQLDTRWLERILPTLIDDEAVASDPVSTPGDAAAAHAPITGVLVAVDVAAGTRVTAGQPIALVEALKMQHAVISPVTGRVARVVAPIGGIVAEGSPIITFDMVEETAQGDAVAVAIDPDAPRADLDELNERLAATRDAARPEAVAKRRRSGQRTARENLSDLFDHDSFSEYGQLAIASGRRGSVEELMRTTPGDGIVTGIGTVNAERFGADARCAGLAYDFTVVAGTQGRINHEKTDRLIAVVEQQKLPLVFYCEGGGGRPGDGSVERGSTGLSGPSFHHFARLSGAAPRIGIASGRCFAGNAVFLGCCDLVIATEDAKIGLGGPAMIEGGGLGTFSPDEIGPIDTQWANGVVDVRVDDEAAATAAARGLLGYFQGDLRSGDGGDQRLLRHVVPTDRLRVFDIRAAITLLADTGSWQELRGGWAPGVVTGFLRIEGRALGLIANDCRHLSGALDVPGCDKAARFMQLCDSFGVPLLSLCDTPGFMVGPQAEETGTVRHGARMFVTAAAMSVPIITVVIRKGYGLGAMAMAGGSLHAGALTVAWPTAEFGGMGLEGAVRLGHRRELEDIADEAARDARYRELVAKLYDKGKAVTVAQTIDIDAVIDPADTRRWITRALPAARTPGSARFVDSW